MQTSTLIRSPGAIALGAFFAGVTGCVLFKDVLDGAPVNTGHVLALAAIVAAIASGHMVWPQLRAGAVVPAALFAVLFAGSTGYVVVSSGARNAETTSNKAAKIADTNAARARELKQLAQADAMHKAATGNVAVECKSGDGTRCRGARATEAVYSAAIKGHNAALKDLGPELSPAGGYAHAAKVIAALPGVTTKADAIEASLTLLLPFVVVLIAELGTIVFLHLGLGHRAAPASVDVKAVAPVDPKPKKRTRRGATERDTKVVSFVTEFRRRHGRGPTRSELQASFPALPRSTAYDYLKAA